MNFDFKLENAFYATSIFQFVFYNCQPLLLWKCNDGSMHGRWENTSYLRYKLSYLDYLIVKL